MWRVRQFWRLRLAIWAISVAVMGWLWLRDPGPFDRTDFYVLMVAVWVPVLLNLAFWRSDARTERDCKARLSHG